MKTAPLHRNTLVLLLLLAATLMQYFIGASGAAGLAVALTLLAIAAVKSRWVIQDFMGLRQCRPFWQHVLDGWLALTVVLIALGFWTANS